MNFSIKPGDYVKYMFAPATGPDVACVVSYIGEPTYVLRFDNGREFQCPASLVEPLSPTEEIEYWRKRAQAAEQTKEKSPAVISQVYHSSVPTQPDGTGGELPGVSNDNGLLVAKCMSCPETHEFEDLTTTIAAVLDLRDNGWLLTSTELKCPVCVETAKLNSDQKEQ